MLISFLDDALELGKGEPIFVQVFFLVTFIVPLEPVFVVDGR